MNNILVMGPRLKQDSHFCVIFFFPVYFEYSLIHEAKIARFRPLGASCQHSWWRFWSLEYFVVLD